MYHHFLSTRHTEIMQIQSITLAKAHVKEPTRTIDTEVAPSTYQLFIRYHNQGREDNNIINSTLVGV